VKVLNCVHLAQFAYMIIGTSANVTHTACYKLQIDAWVDFGGWYFLQSLLCCNCADVCSTCSRRSFVFCNKDHCNGCCWSQHSMEHPVMCAFY